MRIFAVVCVLTLLSGCGARSLSGRSLSDPWEESVDKFKDYFEDLTSRSDQALRGIRRSDITRELNTLIQDCMAELVAYEQDLRDKLLPSAREEGERLGEDLKWMASKLRDHMEDARDQMEKYSQELQAMVEQNVDDVRVRVNAYTRKMKKRINKDTEDIKGYVSDYLGEIQYRSSDHAEHLRTHLEPFVSLVRDNAQAKLGTLKELLRSQVDTMTDSIQTRAQDLNQRLETTSKELRSTLEEKMEEVRQWFQPFLDIFN